MRTNISQKVIDLIAYQMDKRDSEGRQEYGQTMDEVPFDSYKWNDMVIEELVDGIKYIAKENEKLKTGVNSLKMSLEVALGTLSIISFGQAYVRTEDVLTLYREIISILESTLKS